MRTPPSTRRGVSVPTVLVLVLWGTFSAALSGVWAAPATADEDIDEFFSRLIENATYTLESYTSYFPQEMSDSTIDESTIDFWPQMTTKSSAELVEGLIFQYKLRTTFSTQDREMDQMFQEPFDRNLSPPYIDFETFTLRYEADDYTLAIGKDTIEMGLTEIYSPANLFGRGNAANPMRAALNGKWQIMGEYFIEDDTASLTIVPFEQKPFVPPINSRWRGETQNVVYVRLDLPASSVIFNEYHAITPKNFSYLLKYAGTREGYDFYGALHYGPSAYPVLKQNVKALRFAKEFPLSFSPALGISVTSDAWLFTGEAIYQHTLGDRDQDFLRLYLEASVRETDIANYLGFDEIKPIVGYASEKVMDQQSAAIYTADSFYARPNQDSLMVRVEVQHTDEISYGFFHTRNFTNDDYAYAIAVEYRPTDNLTLQLKGVMFGGELDTHLGRFRRNDNIEIGVIMKF